eukprot:404867-Rhodomonas_salina.1
MRAFRQGGCVHDTRRMRAFDSRRMRGTQGVRALVEASMRRIAQVSLIDLISDDTVLRSLSHPVRLHTPHLTSQSSPNCYSNPRVLQWEDCSVLPFSVLQGPQSPVFSGQPDTGATGDGQGKTGGREGGAEGGGRGGGGGGGRRGGEGGEGGEGRGGGGA